jgi:hypothetical protein
MQTYNVKITVNTENQESLNETSENLAWESAVRASETRGVDLGSDFFVAAFKVLKDRYADCAKSYCHLSYVAASTVETLISTGLGLLQGPDDCNCEDHVRERFEILTAIVLSTITSVYAVGPVGWYTNEEWAELPEEDRTVNFTIINPNGLTEEEVGND